MKRTAWIAGALVCAAALRLASLLSMPSLPASNLDELHQQLQAVTDDPENLLAKAQTIAEIESISFQCFDPTAYVVMLPGIDLQPGVAGLDDNGNGAIDDRSELGATHSDDECVVTRAADLPSLTAGLPHLVLQQGAMVACSASDASRTDQWRAIVVGKEGSFLLEPHR